jgi:hypothetical protein
MPVKRAFPEEREICLDGQDAERLLRDDVDRP